MEGVPGTNSTSAGEASAVMVERTRNELMSGRRTLPERRGGDKESKAMKREERKELRLCAAHSCTSDVNDYF